MASLDPLALRELCELHPWDLGRLSAAAGFDRSVLSHVFAGRRSLPQKAAGTFLSLIGMLPSGVPDNRHLFVFQARPGNSALLKSWLTRLLPKGAEVVNLHRSTLGDAVGGVRHGWALFDGETAVLVYGSVGEDLPIGGELWRHIADIDSDLLLDPDNQPERSYFVEEFRHVPSLERYIFDHSDWDFVKRAAAIKGLTPDALLRWIEKYEAPVPKGTLFPRQHQLRKLRGPKG